MKTALVDFDGVLHRYSRGWDDGTAYDPPMPGAHGGLNTLEELGYTVVIFSTRPAEQIRPWLAKWGFRPYLITDKKLPATMIIDDRAVRHVAWEETIAEVVERYGRA